MPEHDAYAEILDLWEKAITSVESHLFRADVLLLNGMEQVRVAMFHETAKWHARSSGLHTAAKVLAERALLTEEQQLRYLALAELHRVCHHAVGKFYQEAMR